MYKYIYRNTKNGVKVYSNKELDNKNLVLIGGFKGSTNFNQKLNKKYA